MIERPTVRFIIGSFCWAVLSASAQAATLLDNLNPYVALGVTYDDNIFRVKDADEMLTDFGVRDQSDIVTRFGAGVDMSLEQANSMYDLQAFIERHEYSDFGEFSHTSGQGLAQWRWDAGSTWHGALGYRYDRRLRDFSNQDNNDDPNGSPLPGGDMALGVSNDLRTEHRGFGELLRRLSSRWETGVSVAVSEISFADTSGLDQLQTRFGAQLNYSTRLDNVIGVEAGWLDGDFDDGDQRNYEEWNLGPTLLWALTRQTRLEGEIFYKERDQNDPTRSDFNGVTGRIVLVRRPDLGGNRYRLTLSREISNLQDEIDDYAIINGIQFEPSRDLTAKQRITALVAYEERDFQVDRNLVQMVGLGGRKDEVFEAGLGYQWRPRNNLVLSLDYSYERRDSNRRLSEYSSNALTAHVRFQFN